MSALTLCTKATPALNAVQSQLTADMTPTAVVGNGLKQTKQFSQCMLHSHIMIWPHPDIRTAITGKETQKIKRLPMQCMYSPKSYSTGDNRCPVSLLPRVWHASGSAHTTFYTLFLQHLYICEPPGTPIPSGGFTSRVMKHNPQATKGQKVCAKVQKSKILASQCMQHFGHSCAQQTCVLQAAFMCVKEHTTVLCFCVPLSLWPFPSAVLFGKCACS